MGANTHWDIQIDLRLGKSACIERPILAGRCKRSHILSTFVSAPARAIQMTKGTETLILPVRSVSE